jgi:Right handed beta helix region
MALTKVTYAMIDGPAVNVKDYGAVGDGTANDTAAIQNALTAAADQLVVFENAKTYKVTDTLTTSANTTIDLNGSTIQFVITGSKKCLQLNDGVTVRNGTVELAGSSYTGSGESGAPILIGDYGVGTGYANILIDNITIISNKTDGNGILVTGDSNNVIIRNVDVQGPNNLASPILVHWGGANDPTAGTTHPHNIRIENLKCGTMSLATATGLTLSGAYDVSIDNVVFDNTVLHAVYVYCGDYGLLYASDANIKVHGIHNIKVNNVTGVRVGYGIYVDMFRNLAPTPAKETCRNIVFENCSFRGNAPTNSARYGTRIRYSDNITFKECVFDNFYQNAVISLSSNDNVFENCQFLNSRVQSVVNWVATETSSTPSAQNQFLNCLFKDSNQSSTASIADINFQWGGRNTIDNCRFDSPLAINNVRIEGSTNSSYNNIVTNNLIVSAPTTTCFVFGGATDYELCLLFNGNRMVTPSAVPGSGFASGQKLLPYALTPQTGSALGVRKMAGDAAPSAGAWTVGETVYFSAPTSGGYIGSVCTVAGTPGTWKSFGTIA